MSENIKGMNDTTRTPKYEAADDQKKRVNRAIDWFAAKYLLVHDEPSKPLTLEYKKLCALAEANYATLSHASHPEEIDISYAGASYLGGRGGPAEVELDVRTWLRNRGKLENHDKIGGGNRQDYIMKEGEFGDN